MLPFLIGPAYANSPADNTQALASLHIELAIASSVNEYVSEKFEGAGLAPEDVERLAEDSTRAIAACIVECFEVFPSEIRKGVVSELAAGANLEDALLAAAREAAGEGLGPNDIDVATTNMMRRITTGADRCHRNAYLEIGIPRK